MKDIDILNEEIFKKLEFIYDGGFDWILELPDDMGVLTISGKLNRNAVLRQDDDMVSLMIVNTYGDFKIVYKAITGIDYEYNN